MKIEQCLYGVKILTDFPLFEDAPVTSAIAPGEHPAIELHELGDRQTKNMPERIPLYAAHNRELFLHTDRELARSKPNQPWRLEVEGVISITWTGGENAVYYQGYQQTSNALQVFWIVHIFLPLYLTLERGYDFIHAAAVEVDDQPILFIAPSTGGKSTLGDYFLKQDHAMLSDDKVATFLHQDEFYAAPSHPYHRPWREPEVLGQPVGNFASEVKPIHAFYLLEQGEPDSDIEISEVVGFRKFEQLMPNYLFNFRFLIQQRLRWLASLADQSLVFRVRRPWNMDRQQEVYEAICAHSRSLPGDPA
jgi:hypothetical protein